MATGLLARAAACALLALASAAGAPARAQDQTVRGEVTAVDVRAGTFAVRAAGEPQPLRFRASATTSFGGDGGAHQLGDLRVGDLVEVRASAPSVGDSLRLALSVQREPAGARTPGAGTSGAGGPGASPRAEPGVRLGQRELPSELPDTGTALPLLALLGGAGLASGLALRAGQRR